MTIDEIKAKGQEREDEMNKRYEAYKEGELKWENFMKAIEHPEQCTTGVVKDYSNASVEKFMEELEQTIRRLEAERKVAEATKELFEILPPEMIAEALETINGKGGTTND